MPNLPEPPCHRKEKVNKMKEIVRYEISMDGVGLLAYWEDGNYYHIHSDELSKLERWILELLKAEEVK